MKTRNQLIFLLLLGISTSTFAQEQSSMLDGNPIWVYYSKGNYTGRDGVAQDVFSTYYLDGDTIIDDVKYHHMYVIWKLKNGEYVLEDEPPHFVADVRTEGNQLLRRKTTDDENKDTAPYEFFELRDKEIILYDFDALKNAETISTFNNGKEEKHSVTQSQATMADGSTRAVYSVGANGRVINKFTIIDNIGSINTNLIYWIPDGVPTPNPNDHPTLDVFIQHGKIVYKAPESEYSEFSFLGQLTTDISSTRNDQPQLGTHAIYNLQGQRIESPQRGVNILRRSDGTTLKVLVK